MSRLKIDTEAGSFTIQMHETRAPRTCRYYQSIAKRGDLDGGSVFRMTTPNNQSEASGCPISVIQLGTDHGLDGQRSTIEHESTDDTGLRHRRWTVSASRFAPGEVYGSFFVCMRDESVLDFGGGRSRDGLGYAAFGEVVAGHEALEKIYARAEDDEVLTRPIPITRVSVDDD